MRDLEKELNKCEKRRLQQVEDTFWKEMLLNILLPLLVVTGLLLLSVGGFLWKM